MDFFTDIMPSFIGEATISPLVGIPGVGGYGGLKFGETDTGKDIFDPGYYFHDSPAERENANTIEGAKERSLGTYKDIENMLTSANNNRFKFATPAMQHKYIQSMENFDPNNYVYDFSDFGYKKSVDDFINQNRDKILADVGKGVQGTAAGAGLGLSRGTVDNAIAAQMDKSEQLWKDAYDQYNRDKDFEYKKHIDNITNNQNRLNTLASLTTGQQQALAGAIGQDENASTDYWTSMVSLLGDKTKTLNDLDLANMKQTRSPTDLFGSVAKFFA